MKFAIALLFAATAAVKISSDPIATTPTKVSSDPKVTYGVRVTAIPDRFDGAESDRLMNSIIGKYSQEKFVDGKPTGEFSMDKSGI